MHGLDLSCFLPTSVVPAWTGSELLLPTSVVPVLTGSGLLFANFGCACMDLIGAAFCQLWLCLTGLDLSYFLPTSVVPVWTVSELRFANFNCACMD